MSSEKKNENEEIKTIDKSENININQIYQNNYHETPDGNLNKKIDLYETIKLKNSSESVLRKTEDKTLNNNITTKTNVQNNSSPKTQHKLKLANTIPFGSFSFSISFVTYGLFRCRVFTNENTYLWAVIILYGGLGQLTSGILEIFKGRNFLAYLYLFYGIYCTSHYFLRIWTDTFGEYDLCIYFSIFGLLNIPIILLSLRSNVLFLIQAILTFIYFLFKAVGEGIREAIIGDFVAGVIQVLSGLVSMYISFAYVTNENHKGKYVRTYPLIENNGIDFIKFKKQ